MRGPRRVRVTFDCAQTRSERKNYRVAKATFTCPDQLMSLRESAVCAPLTTIALISFAPEQRKKAAFFAFTDSFFAFSLSLTLLRLRNYDFVAFASLLCAPLKRVQVALLAVKREERRVHHCASSWLYAAFANVGRRTRGTAIFGALFFSLAPTFGRN